LNIGFFGFYVKKTESDRTETGRFELIPVQIFQFFKILFWLFF
jgi:hypothetical protein